MAAVPACCDSTMMYWSDSPSAASTAVAAAAAGSITSATRATMPSRPVSPAGAAVRACFITARTPSLYHSKLSSIFFRVANFDRTVVRSSSSVCACLTAAPSALERSSSRVRVSAIRPPRVSISALTDSRRAVARPSRSWASAMRFWVWASSSSARRSRRLRPSRLLEAFWCTLRYWASRLIRSIRCDLAASAWRPISAISAARRSWVPRSWSSAPRMRVSSSRNVRPSASPCAISVCRPQFFSSRAARAVWSSPVSRDRRSISPRRCLRSFSTRSMVRWASNLRFFCSPIAWFFCQRASLMPSTAASSVFSSEECSRSASRSRCSSASVSSICRVKSATWCMPRRTSSSLARAWYLLKSPAVRAWRLRLPIWRLISRIMSATRSRFWCVASILRSASVLCCL